MLPLQHIGVADATYKRNAGAGSILRYSENDSGPEVGFEEITVDLLGVRSREFALRDALHQSDSIRSGRRFVELYCELDWRQRP